MFPTRMDGNEGVTSAEMRNTPPISLPHLLLLLFLLLLLLVLLQPPIQPPTHPPTHLLLLLGPVLFCAPAADVSPFRWNSSSTTQMEEAEEEEEVGGVKEVGHQVASALYLSFKPNFVPLDDK